MVSGSPTTSNAWSAPPPVRVRSVRTGCSSADVSTAASAPRSSARRELRRVAVDRDERRGPASFAAASTWSPTPPTPITTTLSPASTCATLPHRAEARHHAAAEQRRLPERQPARERDRPGRRDDDQLGEARRHEPVLQTACRPASGAASCRRAASR
jgi:hypothetical protein